MEFSGKPSQVRKLMHEHVFRMRWRQQQTQRLSEKFYNFTFVRVCTWWRTLQRVQRIKCQFVLSAQCYYWAEIRRVCVIPSYFCFVSCLFWDLLILIIFFHVFRSYVHTANITILPSNLRIFFFILSTTQFSIQFKAKNNMMIEIS